MKQKTGRKLLAFLLTLAMVFGLVQGMGMTALAINPNELDDPFSGGVTIAAYGSLKNTTTVITFDGKQWYLIDYDSDTVTLLSKECVGASEFNENDTDGNTYSGSTVESFVNSWYTSNISTEAQGAVNGNGMFLLTTDQANELSSDVRKCSQVDGADDNAWWLCSAGLLDIDGKIAACVYGDNGNVNGDGDGVGNEYGVRPALKLDLSKVTFDSNTFSLKSETTEYPLWVGDTQVTSANAGNIDGSNKASFDAGTNTLTLNDANITTGYKYTSGNYSYGAGIFYTGTEALNICLADDTNNTVSVNVADCRQNTGIWTRGVSVSFSGNGKLTVNETNTNSDVGISAKNVNISECELDITGGNASISSSGDISIQNAKVTAKAQYAISTNGVIDISKDSIVNATGTERAISGTVKNAIAGIGWTNTDGTEGQENIAISTSGQKLSSYKKVQFPAAASYTVTFDSNGGTGTMESQTITGGADLNQNAFTRTDYVFTGWNTKADGTGDSYSDGDWISGLTSDITLYAQWIEPNVKVGAVFKAGDTMKFASQNQVWVKADSTLYENHGAYSVKISAIEDQQVAFDGVLYRNGEFSTTSIGFENSVEGANCVKVTSGSGTKSDPYILELAVYKDPATVTKAPTAKTLTYTGQAQELVTAGTAEGGTMNYALGENATTAPTTGYTTSIPTKTDAGTYYVWYKAVGDSNHIDSQESSVEVVINKAAPDYTAPEDLTAECGTKVGDIELPEGFAWNSPDSVVMNIGDNEAVLTYTPADTDNYLIVDDIQVIVKGTGIHHAEVSADCEEDGVVEYWEDGAGNKFSDENGKNALTDEQTVIEKLGHNFIHFIKWVWDGFNHAIAWLFCDNDPEHIETIDVPSQIDTVDEPTCTEDGYKYYVATIDVAGKIYTTVNVETLDQLGHKWKESEWNIDGTKASLTLVCENAPSHTKTVDAAVGVTVNEEGTLRTYTAKVTVDGVEYTKTWTEDITPDVPTPDVPTPDVPTPDVPTPDVPTPDVPTPDVPTPDEPTPDKPTPDEPTPAKEIKGILGDVNNDGQVDSADALLILRNSVGLETFDDTQRFLGDVNEDNENIDSSDALAVLRYSVGLIDIEKIGTPVSKTVA